MGGLKQWLLGEQRPPAPDTNSLLQENNALLRELIQAQTGKPAVTRSAPAPARTRKFTAADVHVVRRSDHLQTQAARHEKEQAPWRSGAHNGPGSEPTSPASGIARADTRQADAPQTTAPTPSGPPSGTAT